MTSAQMLAMQGDAEYRKLVADIDTTAAEGGTLIAQVTVTPSAPHPAGLIFIGGTKINNSFWRERSSMQALDAIAGAINLSLAFDRSGTKQDWDIMVEAAHCKQLVKGEFHAPNFLWKYIVRPVLERTVSSAVIAEAEAGEAALWGSPTLLTWAEPIHNA